MGKYDRFLDGRVWVLRPGDVPWFPWGPKVVSALRTRARTRGLRVVVQRLEEPDAVAIQAEARRDVDMRRMLGAAADATPNEVQEALPGVPAPGPEAGGAPDDGTGGEGAGPARGADATVGGRADGAAAPGGVAEGDGGPLGAAPQGGLT